MIAAPIAGVLLILLSYFVLNLASITSILLGALLAVILLAVALASTFSHLEGRLSATAGQTDALMRENGELRATNEKLAEVKVAYDTLVVQAAKYEVDLKDNDSQITALRTDRTRLAEEAETLKAQADALQALNVSLQFRVKDAGEKIAALEQERQRLTALDEATTKERDAFQTLNTSLQTRLRESSDKMLAQEEERARLAHELEMIGKERDGLQNLNITLQARLKARLGVSEAAVAGLHDQLKGKDQQIHDEQIATARAPYMPQLNATLATEKTGWMAPARHIVHIQNVGGGPATDIAVSMAFGRGAQEPEYSPRDYWVALSPGEHKVSVVGTLPQLAGTEWVRLRIAYKSQFGPRPPIEIAWKL